MKGIADFDEMETLVFHRHRDGADLDQEPTTVWDPIDGALPEWYRGDQDTPAERPRAKR